VDRPFEITTLVLSTADEGANEFTYYMRNINALQKYLNLLKYCKMKSFLILYLQTFFHKFIKYQTLQ
jgi:hypothetical protein